MRPCLPAGSGGAPDRERADIPVIRGPAR
jgi:hypothetical protein